MSADQRERDGTPLQAAGEADLRERIREVAYDLLGQHGYHGTTTRMIANALGVSVPALYYHYGSKQELLVGVMRADIQEAVALLKAAIEPHNDPALALDAAIRSNVQRRFQLRDSRTIHRTEMRFVEPAYRDEIVRYRDEFEHMFVDLVVRCIDAGLTHLTDRPSLLARAALQMMNGISDWYRPGGTLSETEIEDLYVRLVWNLLAIECPPPQLTNQDNDA